MTRKEYYIWKMTNRNADLAARQAEQTRDQREAELQHRLQQEASSKLEAQKLQAALDLLHEFEDEYGVQAWVEAFREEVRDFPVRFHERVDEASSAPPSRFQLPPLPCAFHDTVVVLNQRPGNIIQQVGTGTFRPSVDGNIEVFKDHVLHVPSLEDTLRITTSVPIDPGRHPVISLRWEVDYWLQEKPSRDFLLFKT